MAFKFNKVYALQRLHAANFRGVAAVINPRPVIRTGPPSVYAHMPPPVLRTHTPGDAPRAPAFVHAHSGPHSVFRLFRG